MLSYKNLTGYFGSLSRKPTLHSKLVYTLHTFARRKKYVRIYPQRVPKQGYYEEICELDRGFKRNYASKIKGLRGKVLQSISFEELEFYLHFLSRLGDHAWLFEFVSKHRHNDIGYDFLKIFITVNHDLSNDNKIDLGIFDAVVAKITKKQRIETSMEATILNFLIVVANRFKVKKARKIPSKIFDLLTTFLNEQQTSSFERTLLASKIYRGISMDDYFTMKQRQSFLDKAEMLALELASFDAYEVDIRRENLFTLYQTLSKWNLMRGHADVGEVYLKKMTLIDPRESVSFSELGFLYQKIGDAKKAGQNFKKAFELGPPAVGMNRYFYALNLHQTGRKKAAMENMIKVQLLDKESFSAYYKTFEWCEKKSEKKKWANVILKNQNIYTQADPHELHQLQKANY